jgi:uncharacterized protein YkwD
MTSQNCFAHQCPGEGPLAVRLVNAGYLVNGLSGWGYAEVIAWGTRSHATPRSIVGAWMDSPPHRAYLLSGAFEHFGIGFKGAAPTSANAHAGTYTVDLGFRSG